MIHKTWNVSQRIMLGLDRKTHKYLIEPVGGTRQIIFNLHKRFINFTNKLATSKKTAVRGLLDAIKNDCQSTTGHNLRLLMLYYQTDRIKDLKSDITDDRQYVAIPKPEEWRVNFIKDVKHGISLLPGFDREEINNFLNFACIS